MNDYTPSDAANDYATSYAPAGGYRPWSPRHSEFAAAFDAGIAHERESRKPRTITTASELAAAGNVDLRTPLGNLVSGNDHDGWEITGKERAMATAEVAALAPLTLLVPASESAPEPVRLTAAEAAGLRPGSWVRGESNDGSAVVGVIRQREVAVSFDGMIRWFDPAKFDRLYLLAEAPDPDAEKVAALVNYGLTETAARGHLAILREAGLRVDQ